MPSCYCEFGIPDYNSCELNTDSISSVVVSAFPSPRPTSEPVDIKGNEIPSFKAPSTFFKDYLKKLKIGRKEEPVVQASWVYPSGVLPDAPAKGILKKPAVVISSSQTKPEKVPFWKKFREKIFWKASPKSSKSEKKLVRQNAFISRHETKGRPISMAGEAKFISEKGQVEFKPTKDDGSGVASGLA